MRLLRACAVLMLGGVSSWGCVEKRPAGEETVAVTGVDTEAARAAAAPTQLFTDATSLFAPAPFVHDPGAGGDLVFPEMMGGGVAVFDADEDGDLDLYFVSGAPSLGRESTRGGPTNRLYLQSDDGRFEDGTEGSGLDDAGYGTGVAIGDVNNDGHEDVFVANFGPDHLYLGRGHGRFDDATATAGIRATGESPEDWSTSAAFCDLDRDGWLDLYVVRYVVFDRSVECTDKAGRREYCGPDSFDDRTDVLLRNLGNGSFEDITHAAGIAESTGAGLGVVCEDVNDDGWTDLYVANDGDPNQLWMNQGTADDGTLHFVDDALILGASVNASGLSEAGMGVVAADFDGDADFDLFLTHLRDETNTFYRNLGSGLGFEDRSTQAGLANDSTQYTGFGTAPIDFDLDGDLDLLIANGRVTRGDVLEGSLPEPWRYYAEPNLVYRNLGEAFEVANDEAVAFSREVEVSRGLASGDLDGDGDLDVVLSNIASPARLLRAEAPAHHWLVVDAFDPRLKRRALGARVTLESANKKQVRTISGASSYLSSSDPRAHFGLGLEDSPVTVLIRWPDGLEESFSQVTVDQAIVFDRGSGGS